MCALLDQICRKHKITKSVIAGPTTSPEILKARVDFVRLAPLYNVTDSMIGQQLNKQAPYVSYLKLMASADASPTSADWAPAPRPSPHRRTYTPARVNRFVKGAR